MRYDAAPPRIERIEVASGLLGQSRILVTPDGESYAYSFFRRLDDLYLSSPLR